MRKRWTIVVVVFAVTLVSHATPAPAQRLFELLGQITNAENLVLTEVGDVEISLPEPSDLPLDYTATLSVPSGEGPGSISFSYMGSSTSPGSSFSFSFALGLPVELETNNDSLIEIVQEPLVPGGDEFSLTLDLTTGQGSWSLLQNLLGPSLDPAERTVQANITSFTIVPEPASLALLAAAFAGVVCHRRG